jgi:hypothetical protein
MPMNWPDHRMIERERQDPRLHSAWPVGKRLPNTAGEHLCALRLPHGVRGGSIHRIGLSDMYLELADTLARATRFVEELRCHAIIVDLKGASLRAFEQRLLFGQLLMNKASFNCSLRFSPLRNLRKMQDISRIQAQLCAKGINQLGLDGRDRDHRTEIRGFACLSVIRGTF